MCLIHPISSPVHTSNRVRMLILSLSQNSKNGHVKRRSVIFEMTQTDGEVRFFFLLLFSACLLGPISVDPELDVLSGNFWFTRSDRHQKTQFQCCSSAYFAESEFLMERRRSREIMVFSTNTKTTYNLSQKHVQFPKFSPAAGLCARFAASGKSNRMPLKSSWHPVVCLIE